jgi:hypothetical protein
MQKIIKLVFIVFLLAGVAYAADLGRLNRNPYDPNSVSNPYGAGSPYAPNGVNNPYTIYGSP